MLTRDQKVQITEEFAKKAKDSQSILLVDFTGLKMSEIQSLRRELRKSGVEMKVIKKTLVQRILKGAGISAFNVFQYPASLAMVFSPEEGIIVSKNVYDFSKKSKTLKILGGFIGKNFIDAEMIVKLAKLPSREVLLGQLVYVLNSLPRTLVGVLQGNLRKLVIALDQISKTK
ncbi:MAG TPA: 50S ribosomal protein L10 [Candidatus Paceibacterota bacterium]|nr:50S ribosomal protein L10 [Candidatus Paceibacterota bacterium]